MNIKLNWKRPLFYALLPVFLILAFVGFPPPFAPPQRIKPSQEQSVPAEERTQRGSMPFRVELDIRPDAL
jgi:hypothetical protein